LTATSDEALYGGNNNPNYNQHYAEARHLCYYVQGEGAAGEVLREFVAKVKSDPTVNTVRRVLGEKDIVAFQKKWEKFAEVGGLVRKYNGRADFPGTLNLSRDVSTVGLSPNL
jgi:hypothetical protein